MKRFLFMLLPIFISGISAFGCSEDHSLEPILAGINEIQQIIQEPQKHTEGKELGEVHWYRNLDTALVLAAQTGKDVLILFQEVPGCATCRNYGQNVLSHPLMVEAIENEFIPLAIFNNKGGEDKKALTRFNEPSWNNPVVRFVDKKGTNITPRIAGDYEATTLAKRMKTILEERNKTVPEYLTLLIEELSSSNAEEIEYYSMYCFWSGEKEIGKLDGVLNTRAGFIDGREVVKVTFNSQKMKGKDLESSIKNKGCIPIAGDFKESQKDVHYYLRNSMFNVIPMTELQKTKINSALGLGRDVIKYLSPKQLNWFISDNLSVSMVDKDIDEGWGELMK